MKATQGQLRWLRGELEEWEREGLLPAATATALRRRYPSEAESGGSGWMTAILGIFGSLLIVGGLILLFAHNWHGLSRGVRTALALAPLLVFQGLGLWLLRRPAASAAWREGVGGGLVLSIGAAIALIAQTYQLGGDFGRFMFAWTLLALPAVYLLRSGTALWLYLAGSVVHAGYTQTASSPAMIFFGLLAAALPFVLWIHRRGQAGARALLSRYALALAFWTGAPFALDFRWDGLWLPLLTMSAGAMVLWDRSPPGRDGFLGRRPFALSGTLVLGGLLLVFSFGGVWRAYGEAIERMEGAHGAMPALAALVGLGWIAGVVRRAREGAFWPVLLGGGTGSIALLASRLATAPGADFPLMLATNLLALAVGLGAIVQALRTARLGLLNFGLLLVGGLVLLRFFDADLGFVARGLGFIALGVGFLVANLLFVRHRRATRHAHSTLAPA
jgi:hypothetical protein